MSLFDRFRGTKGAAPVATAAANAAAPVIGNEGEWKSDRNVLRLLLGCILRVPELDAEDDKLLSHLWNVRDSLDNCQQVIAAVRRYAKTASLPDDIRARYTAAAQDAATTAEEVSKAYRPEAKLNWRSVFWCDSSPELAPEHRRFLHDDAELPFARETKFVNERTPIGSAGSCFATEIRKLLVNSGYNYVETEKNRFASAGWGGLYNIPSIRQLVEKAFGLTSTPKILVGTENFRHPENPDPRQFDPFRENGSMTYDEYVEGYQQHLDAAREAFLACEVFVLTLGMVEAWYLKSTGSVFSRVTWAMSPALLDRRVIGFEENRAELQLALDILRAHNPKLKIVLSVSPVPLHATFQGDRQHVIAATCAAKSVLRAVAEEISQRNDFVHYFPSYETVMYGTEKPFLPDNRHVSPHAVRKVGMLFEKMFVEKGAKPLVLPVAE